MLDPEGHAWYSDFGSQFVGELDPKTGKVTEYPIPVVRPDVFVTKERDTIQATHGSFDNNIGVLTATLERIRGAKLIAPMEWLDY